MEFICVWSNGTWCYEEEVESMTHLSDDYYWIDASAIENIEEFVTEFLKDHY
jgi:predicted transglutaminase-like protease